MFIVPLLHILPKQNKIFIQFPTVPVKTPRANRYIRNSNSRGDVIDLVSLFEPHKAKCRNFCLPWQGRFEVLSRTSEVTYMICKQGKKQKLKKMHSNRLKPYRSDPEVRQSTRHKNRPLPIYEEQSNETETKEKTKTARSTCLSRRQQGRKPLEISQEYRSARYQRL